MPDDRLYVTVYMVVNGQMREAVKDCPVLSIRQAIVNAKAVKREFEITDSLYLTFANAKAVVYVV